MADKIRDVFSRFVERKRTSAVTFVPEKQQPVPTQTPQFSRWDIGERYGIER
jgi:hypothetical protein